MSKTKQSQPAVFHQPVMLNKALEYLNVQPHHWYIDATFGRGGHTQAILNQDACVIAFDVDQEAIAYGKKQFESAIKQERLILVQANFAQLETEVSQLINQSSALTAISGFLFDFGTSQDQIKAPHRGFSFEQPEAALDMRMDQNLGVTAADLLAVLSVKQLTQLFKEYGGEEQAKKIAQAIDKFRGPNKQNKIQTVGQLVKIIEQVKKRHSHLHPATKVFQALRIAVNNELSNIEDALPQALSLIENRGRIVTIAFHQGEDRIAKQQFKNWEEQNMGQILTNKPLTPTKQEIDKNPSARSAKLRAFEKLS
jgi:16S rRNA (cytosine1402-N4)-methyltransferase